MPEPDEQLQAAKSELVAATVGWRVWMAHLIPDLVLYRYALDVLEHASLVAAINDIGVGRAAVANARAGFEAALDMLLLASEQDRFDERGVLVRVCELLELEQLEARRDAALVELSLPEGPSQRSPEEAIEADANLWTGDFPGAREVLRRELANVRRDGRWKRHWSQMSRKEIAAHLETTYTAGEGIAEMIDSTYGVLSFHSHPRPRIGARDTSWVDGRLTFAPRPGDLRLAKAIASLACKLALRAMSRRDSWQVVPPPA